MSLNDLVENLNERLADCPCALNEMCEKCVEIMIVLIAISEDEENEF